MKVIESSKLRIITTRLWKGYIRVYTKLIMLTAILLIISSAATSYQPMLIQQAFDKVFEQHDPQALIVVPLMIVGVFIVQAITTYWSNKFMGLITNGLIADMRKKFLYHVIENEIEFYSRNDAGNLLTRVIPELIHVSAAISNFFNSWCRQLVTAVGLLGVMLYQSVELTLLSLCAFAFAFYPLQRITKMLRKRTRELSDKNSKITSRIIESLAGIRTVKAFRKEEFEIDKLSSYVDEIKNSSNSTNSYSIISVPMLQVLSGLAIAFVIWYGGNQLIGGTITKGNLVAFMAALMMFSRPVRSLSNAGGVMTKGYNGAERFFEIIDSKPKYISRDHGNSLAVSQAEVRFESVGFTYPSGAEALSEVSFVAPAGKKTALVGHSGSGKSTIFSLLMKFYDTTHGRILIDGQDLAAASINSARAQFAFVSQDIFIFDETVMNNIGYGREGASVPDIIEAAKAAHCHDFIMQLPKGYDTKLGFAGETLSGGQKQRIAIARAFLRNAPILLLDEATSALDPKTENEIQESLALLSEGRTTIVIAHRLSTVSNADQMILMEAGRVAGVGTHESLMRDSLLYRSHFGL